MPLFRKNRDVTGTHSATTTTPAHNTTAHNDRRGDEPIVDSKHPLKADLLAAFGEFLGTFVFLLLGLAGIQAARDASVASSDSGLNAAFLLMASTSMAMALTLAIFLFWRVSGAAFNPNISLALWLVKAISFRRFILYALAQIIGAIAASAVLLGLLPGPLLVRTQRQSGTNIAQALFIEMFFTFALTMVVLMVAIEKNKTTILTPLAIGFALFATQLAGIQYTGAAVNTARAFGPAVVTGEFIGSHWIYWVGPTLGAILAAALYWFLRKVHYWNLTPGADAQGHNEASYGEKHANRGVIDSNHHDGHGLTGRHDGVNTGHAGTGAHLPGTGAHTTGTGVGNTGTGTANMHPTGHNMV